MNYYLAASFLPSLYKNLETDSSGRIVFKSINQIPIILGNVIQILLAIIVVLAVIFIIYAGIQYIISQGDPGKTASAKKSITNAVVGIFISSGAYLIVDFLGRQFS